VTASAPRGAMTLPDIVATAFGTVARNPRPFYLLAAPAAFISAALAVANAAIINQAGLTTVNATDKATGSQTLAFIALFAVALLGGVLALVIGDMLIIPAAIDALLGRKPDLSHAMRVFQLGIGAALLIWLAWCVLGAIMATGILIPVSLLFGVRWCFSLQEICLNHHGARPATRASSELVRGTWWRVFLIQIAITVLALLPIIVAQRAAAGISNDALAIAIGALAYWLVAPFLSVGRTVLWADVKLRKGQRLVFTPPSDPVRLDPAEVD
jgi:hypothetical protein